MSEIVFNTPQSISSDFQSQIENFQTTLASLNQQVISLQEALQERDQEIAGLKESTFQAGFDSWKVKSDNTLTIVELFINLYKFLAAIPAQQK
ncbi:hypothetical protein A3I48_02385 [Candidatus Daviesbacteria bacterium RIFCSPLOWO2_02_FULL_36_7]|uniref:Uncharacterized protein n=1 Tax=Candidatus Daviesbacteria bacterium RIFCSPLOWO2_02_FULL_36_7 TaxID=1797792 RepID=A0A1F5MIA0_9BACT|nr:MAG: hypothetical protein A3I48_02385 [Candidatus Daviesbacteria bacterium RIFCSPLOWO2_02_FULL_36_7]